MGHQVEGKPNIGQGPCTLIYQNQYTIKLTTSQFIKISSFKLFRTIPVTDNFLVKKVD